MVFSSHLFLFWFLPLALLLYYAVPRRGSSLVLTLLSYVFYGWANPLFVLLLITSTLIDYICGRAIASKAEAAMRAGAPGDRARRLRRAAVAVSVAANLSLLGFFKYFNFAVDNIDLLLGGLGLDAWRLDTALRITLPLGISFYTFQSMSYSIDIYRGHARPLRNIIDFACYVSMFPQLVAGPIIRFSEISEQLRNRSHTIVKFARGAALVSLGLAKKILIANPCGKVADSVFDAAAVATADAWYGAFAYAFQIYFDFSAYSDIAIGLGLMLGFVFPKNFDSPYLAHSITDFWRRWHISFSSWLRDYLYIPLGGNRRGVRRTYINLLLVMLLGGLWHGAAWTFVVWGLIHGVMLLVERAMGKNALYRRLPEVLRVAVTFLIVVIGWVFFRADNMGAALRFLAVMGGFSTPAESAALHAGILYQPYYIVTFLLAAALAWGAPQAWDWTRRLTGGKIALTLLLLALSALILAMQAYNPFIYFIF